MKLIKVHYYNVISAGAGPVLSDVLKALSTQQLEDRLKICGLQRLRLDEAQERIPADGSPTYWLMRFSKLRDDNWPGVLAHGHASKDLELEEDQFLSEETFAIYSPSGGKFAVQYNHFGVRAPKIKEYFNAVVNHPEHGFIFSPVLTNEALEKYGKKQIITSIDATIEGVSDADIAIMEGSGIEAALKQSVEAKANGFKINFWVDARVKKNKIDRGWVDRVIDGIKRRGGENDSIIVTAKENEEDAVEVINLLEARKVSQYNADAIDRTIGRRYEPVQMYGLLEQSLRDWTAAEGK